MFSRLQLYAALIGSALLAVFTIYFRGKSSGAAELEYELKDDRLEKILKAKEIHHDIQELGEDDIALRARKWVRDAD